VLRAQGQYAEALAELRRCHELGSKTPEWPYPSAEWVAETERFAALANRLPAILKGEDRPRDIPEGLIVARTAYDRGHAAAAARLLAEALAADPKLVDDRKAGHRYNAASAAALAAAGRGKDDPPPDDDAKAKAKLRGQALGWLKAEHDAWAKLPEGDSKVRTQVVETLRHWKLDPDLAGVRGADALAKLPGAEAKQWRALWADVDTLFKKAQGP
jgi:hypothetical protein